MASGLFVTGTDTDSGKTLIACALLTVIARQGLSTAGYKPVAAGAQRTPGGLRNDDARWLREFSSVSLDYDEVNPVTLEAAMAPHIAARRAGVDLDAVSLVDQRRRLGLRARVIVTEGAGGWRVPLSGNYDMADLAVAIGDPIVLVVGMKLGCLNHALLTTDAIRASGGRLAGWIANRIDPGMAAPGDNLATLAGRLECPCLGSVPWLGDVPMDHKVELASRAIDEHLVGAALATG